MRPGLFFEPTTKRYHIRLAHTHQRALGDENYGGETDPRKLRLVVAGAAGSTLSLKGAHYVRVQDVVVRGSRSAAISVNHSINVEFHGVTSYGGSSAFSPHCWPTPYSAELIVQKQAPATAAQRNRGSTINLDRHPLSAQLRWLGNRRPPTKFWPLGEKRLNL